MRPNPRAATALIACTLVGGSLACTPNVEPRLLPDDYGEDLPGLARAGGEDRENRENREDQDDDDGRDVSARHPRAGAEAVQLAMKLRAIERLPDGSVLSTLTLRAPRSMSVSAERTAEGEPLLLPGGDFQVLQDDGSWSATDPLECGTGYRSVKLSPGTEYTVQVHGRPALPRRRRGLVRVHLTSGLVSAPFLYDPRAPEGEHECIRTRASQQLGDELRARGFSGDLTERPDPAGELGRRLGHLGDVVLRDTDCEVDVDEPLRWALTELRVRQRFALRLDGYCDALRMRATLVLDVPRLSPAALRAAELTGERDGDTLSLSLAGSKGAIRLEYELALDRSLDPSARPPDRRATRWLTQALRRELVDALAP